MPPSSPPSSLEQSDYDGWQEIRACARRLHRHFCPGLRCHLPNEQEAHEQELAQVLGEFLTGYYPNE